MTQVRNSMRAGGGSQMCFASPPASTMSCTWVLNGASGEAIRKETRIEC